MVFLDDDVIAKLHLYDESPKCFHQKKRLALKKVAIHSASVKNILYLQKEDEQIAIYPIEANMNLAHSIEEEALRLGFSACGFAKAEPISANTTHILNNWLNKKYHAGMGYMERNHNLRTDPTQLVPGCRTLIVTALNYYPKQLLPKEGYQIAYYAYGKDYHRVVKDKLYQLLDYIKKNTTDVEGRAFCDTAPLLERYWAVKAGLGTIGRNRQLIIPGKGSYFFLGVLAITVDIGDTGKKEIIMDDLCSNCNRCIRSCPTQALTLEGIDCRHCLSYLTIEHRGAIPDGIASKLGRRIYGCDMCQQVCPHNLNALPTEENSFDLPPQVAALTPTEWHNLTKEQYKKLFKNSAIERAGYEGLMRNIGVANGKE